MRVCKEFNKDHHSLIQIVLEMCIDNAILLYFGKDGMVFLVHLSARKVRNEVGVELKLFRLHMTCSITFSKILF